MTDPNLDDFDPRDLFEEECRHGTPFGSPCGECDEEDDDVEVDTCLGCGGVTWSHRGVQAWDQKKEGCIAPQLCIKCWKEQGYSLPDLSDISDDVSGR